MPKEIKILLPSSTPDDVFDIQIMGKESNIKSTYRFENWDMNKDNPNNLNTADYLKDKIKNYDNNWEVAEIFTQEKSIIPVLLSNKTKNKLD